MNTQIGRYRILSELGAGGMGIVYRALDLDLQREVALKRLRSEFAASPNILERFQREAQLQGRLNHINIAQLYSLAQTPEAFCIVMELVEGVVLKSLIPLPWTSALQIAVQALAGLGYAHSEGVLHRDIKPENILIDRHGIVKIMDFGIAHAVGAQPLTREKVLIGTIEYMPPERIRGAQVDHRADIYSMGILLFEILTGRLPHTAATEYELMNWHLEGALPSPASFIQCPAELDAVLVKATAKKPEDRFASCEEMSIALREVLVSHGAVTESLDKLNLALNPGLSVTIPVKRKNLEEGPGTRLVDANVNSSLFSGTAVGGSGLRRTCIGALTLCLVGVLVWWFTFHGGKSSPRPVDFQKADVPKVATPSSVPKTSETPDQTIQNALHNVAVPETIPPAQSEKKSTHATKAKFESEKALQQRSEQADAERVQQEAALRERQRELDLQAADQSARQEQLENERRRLQTEQEKIQAMVAETERKQQATPIERAHEQPEPQQHAAASTGQNSGTIVWRGTVRGTTLVTINGNSSDVGQIVSGALPGVLVIVQPADARHVGVASTPAPSNSYQRLVLRIQGTGDLQETVQWSIP